MAVKMGKTTEILVYFNKSSCSIHNNSSQNGGNTVGY